ncbi:MAG: 50S ribosomal protein L11 methyltransferase [Thermoleophilia bacterium]|nr:50S ribosomal protein L11 methyltransferase [Thermoleophilia bacterium]
MRRVRILVPEPQAEEARARLIELAPAGFEEETSGGTLVLVAYADEASEPRVRAAFPGAEVEDLVPGWEDAWKRFHRPARIGPLWIGPPWERPEDGSLPVVVEPGRAFGTGAHATTRLVVTALLSLPPSSLLDLGCGSGVLALAAARLGFAPVIAVDHDAAAVEATEANARANGLEVKTRRMDVLASSLPAAAVAVANIDLSVVTRLAARVEAEHLVTSGYLAGERFQARGWRHFERREADGWAADVFTRARAGA